MSDKIFNLKDLEKMLRPGADPLARKLFEQRMEEEAAEDVREAAAGGLKFGPPPVPDAQLVYSPASNKVGVAIRGAQRICELPKEYTGTGMELALIPGNRLIVTHPNHSPLLIDPQTGTTRKL
ncbi:hypothetical protein LT85_1015 [Collimonas arenae]|uniref:Uncharacterized protein n=1 Tax=Collimonas arenae TaxID=279058 RepID=A0A0A1F636_9BURK|nr:hypothetical protein [Collimonas arenae]AIY40173.1 hypothetical protein LT85_1015 [Collimonas arenae]